TCTIVTTSASEALQRVHDRMPVIIADAAYERWLDPASVNVADLLGAWSGAALRAYPVSTRVNAVRNDDAQLCEAVDPIAPEVPEQVTGATEADDADEAIQPRLI